MVIINSFCHPESNIRLVQRNVHVILDKRDLGVGTVYISENTFCWQQGEGSGFTISYPDISLHGVSKDENVYSKECLYMVLDGRLTMTDEKIENEDSDDCEEKSSTEISELLFVPEENALETVQSMYEAIKICQELNPDPNDEDEDYEDDHLYEDAEDMEDDYPVPGTGGGGDADVDDLSNRLGRNVSVIYDYANGSNEDEEFQDAD